MRKQWGIRVGNRRGFLQPLLIYYLWLAFMVGGRFVTKLIEKLSVGMSW